jgi:hypothetical protein
MQKREPSARQTENFWTCPFCQQKIRLGAYGFCPSAEFVKNCLLPDHIRNDECLAFRDPRKARMLLTESD